MCYHVSLTKSTIEVEDRFEVRFEEPEVYEPTYHLNGFSNNPIFIIPQQESHLIEPAKWGLIPEYIEDPERFQKSYNTLNAKSENLFTSTTWREPIKHSRCLILADGFFESKHVQKGKYPHYIRLKSKEAFAFAGIYTYHDKGVFSCSIITKEANSFMAEIHNSKKRMPLILDKSVEKEWLSPNFSREKIDDFIDNGFTKEEFEAYTVSKDVNNPRVNSNYLDILKPYHYPELNTLF